MVDRENGWRYFELGSGMGYSMIPGWRGSKYAALETWKEFQERTPTPAEIEDWKLKYQKVNPLLVTGKASGVIVLDVDGPEGYKTLLNTFGSVPPTVTVQTPGGPHRDHYYFQYDPAIGLIHGFVRGYNKELKGLDLRADGNYAVFPGSEHENGGSYKFKEERSFDEIEVAPLPLWLREYILEHNRRQATRDTAVAPISLGTNNFPVPAAFKGREIGKLTDANYHKRLDSYAKAALRNQVQEVASSAKGQRNDALFKAAASLATFVAHGVLPASEMERELEDASRSCGLARDDGIGSVRSSIKSGLRKGYNNPLPILPAGEQQTNYPRDAPQNPFEYQKTKANKPTKKKNNLDMARAIIKNRSNEGIKGNTGENKEQKNNE